MRNINISLFRFGFQDEGYRTFTSCQQKLNSYKNKSAAPNVHIVSDNGNYCIEAVCNIAANTELNLRLGVLYWLHTFTSDPNPVVRIVSNLMFDLNRMPGSVDPDLSTWQRWTNEQCDLYLTKLNLDKEGQFYKGLHIEGYNSR